MKSNISTLPLKSKTPRKWAKMVLKEPLILLSDHAYLEKKAATNALNLLNRWPEPHHPDEWAPTLTSIARDEALHLNTVTRLLKKRGGKLQRKHHNQYTTDLRDLVRRGLGPKEIIDRLLVSALIEARSCERFGVLAQNNSDKELQALYQNLWSSEFGHFQVFLELAKKIGPSDEVEKRWKEFLKKEAEIMSHQPAGPRIHSGHQ